MFFLEPTRITSSTATCIDNVFCNCDYKEKHIINSLPSDHCGLMVAYSSYLPLLKTQIRFRQTTFRKDINQNGLEFWTAVLRKKKFTNNLIIIFNEFWFLFGSVNINNIK